MPALGFFKHDIRHNIRMHGWPPALVFPVHMIGVALVKPSCHGAQLAQICTVKMITRSNSGMNETH